MRTPEDIGTASNMVTSVMSQAQGMASESMLRGLAAIEKLAAFKVDLPELAAPDFLTPTITPPEVGSAPDDPGEGNALFPALPDEPEPGTLGVLVLDDAPAYDLVAPLLADIALPDPFDALLPQAPVLNEVATPVEPDFSLPAVPTLLGLNLPSAPTLDLPLFTDEAPAAPDAPDARFVWVEVAYASDQLATLNSRLLSLVNGESTALAPEIEEALWQRDCDAEALTTHQAVAGALQMSAARGFAIPGGQLVRLVQQAIAASANRDTDNSRRIMAEQAQLEQTNFQFAFGAAVQFESRLIEHFNQVQARALDSAKFTVSALIELFNAQVNLYQADVQAFGAKAEVFKTRLQAALAQLDVYKAELEGQKVIGELNVQMAQQYSAQIEGVKALAEVFRARVEAVTLTVQTNRNRSSLYRAQIEGYAAQVKANTLGVQGYLSQLQGEQAKTQIVSEQISGYTSRVQAFRALTDAKLSEATLQFRQLQEFPVELYRGRIDAFQAQVSAEAQRLSARAAIFNARVDGYATVERVNTAHVGAQAEVAKTTTQLYASQAQLALQAGMTNLKLAQNNSETMQAAYRAGGQLTAQMASAALSARNVSASLTGLVSNSASASVSNSHSRSSSNGKSYSSSTNTNFSSTTGTSNSSHNSVNNSTSISDNQTSSDLSSQSATLAVSNAISNSRQRSVRNSSSYGMRRSTSFANDTVYVHKG